MSRLKPLNKEEYEAVINDLHNIAARVLRVADIIGPGFGAAWCDKALKIERLVSRLEMQVKDRFYDQTRFRDEE